MDIIEKKLNKAIEKIGTARTMEQIAYALLRRGSEMLASARGVKSNETLVTMLDGGGIRVTRAMDGHRFLVVPDDAKSTAEALRAAGQQFLAYEESHRAKGTADADAKADVNKAMAAMCFAAIGEPVPEQSGYMLGLFPISTDRASFSYAVNTLVENGYERGVDHKNLMVALFDQAAEIGFCHGWPNDVRIVAQSEKWPVDVILHRPMVQEDAKSARQAVQEHESALPGADIPDQPVPTLARLSDVKLWLCRKSDVARKHGMIDAARVLDEIERSIDLGLVDEPPLDIELALRMFYQDVHERNVKAGWWSDLATNEPKKRNVGELLMLFVTEIWEAYDAYCQGAADDKLPQYPGIGVELGDLQIRLADLAGALAAGKVVGFSGTRNPGETALLHVGEIAREYEAIRKTPAAKGSDETGDELAPMDVAVMVTDKLAFNAQRPDHKREARMAEGGKVT